MWLQSDTIVTKLTNMREQVLQCRRRLNAGNLGVNMDVREEIGISLGSRLRLLGPPR